MSSESKGDTQSNMSEHAVQATNMRKRVVHVMRQRRQHSILHAWSNMATQSADHGAWLMRVQQKRHCRLLKHMWHAW